jgi:hypothetical protein
MTGSWFRTPEVVKLLPQSPTGEISLEHKEVIEAAGRRAISIQKDGLLRPLERDDPDFTWERTDKTEALRSRVN